jgi:hypothetical protein
MGRQGDFAEFPAPFTRGVSAADQDRLKAIFPELRLLYNAKLGLFQCVHREPGWRQTFYVAEGLALITGWSIIPGNYPPPLDIEDILKQLCARRDECIAALARTGRGSIVEAAEKIADEFMAKLDAQADADMDEVLGMRTDGTVNPFGLASSATISRAYVMPKGPGAKEQARAERRRLDRCLRQGIET